MVTLEWLLLLHLLPHITYLLLFLLFFNLPIRSQGFPICIRLLYLNSISFHLLTSLYHWPRFDVDPYSDLRNIAKGQNPLYSLSPSYFRLHKSWQLANQHQHRIRIRTAMSAKEYAKHAIGVAWRNPRYVQTKRWSSQHILTRTVWRIQPMFPLPCR